MTAPEVAAWVYILLCSDEERSTYIGFTTWLVRRIFWHQTGYFKRAFTADKRPVIVLGAIPMGNRRAALKLERRLKGLRREQKFAFLLGDRELYDYLARNENERRRLKRKWMREGREAGWFSSCLALEKECVARWQAGETLVGIAELVEKWVGVRPCR